MEINIKILKSIIKGNVIFKGNESILFSGIQNIAESASEHITWIKPNHPEAETMINTTLARGVICNQNTYMLYKGMTENKLFILSEDPKKIFVNILQYINNEEQNVNTILIDPTAIVHPDCKLGNNVSIGAYSIIDACTIGANCIIKDHVKIYSNVTIGNNCNIREFCSIGGSGFGYHKNENGTNEHIPHIGSVCIEDNVDIFPYVNIDRGTLGKTLIKSCTKIDHYVHIGHNSQIGSDNVIAAGCILAGGAKIGDSCFIGVKTLIKEKCEIGSNVITGMGAVVIKNIPSNEVWVGNPAKFLKMNKE